MLNKQTFFIGDCVEALDERASSGAKYRTTVTSPPYNIGIDYDDHKDNMTREKYEQFTKEWSRAVLKVTSNNGWLFLNYGEQLNDLFFSHDMAKIVEKSGWHLRNRIDWVRRNPAYHSHYGNLTQITEFIFLFSKKKNTYLEDRYAIGIKHMEEDFYKRKYKNRTLRNGIYIRDRGTFWLFYKNVDGDYSEQFHATNVFESRIVMKNQSSKKPWELHPARFPLILPAACISISATTNDKILDPFCGTGTTNMAAALMGFESDGIDKSQTYIKAAKLRLKQSNERLPTFIVQKQKRQKERALF